MSRPSLRGGSLFAEGLEVAKITGARYRDAQGVPRGGYYAELGALRLGPFAYFTDASRAARGALQELVAALPADLSSPEIASRLNTLLTEARALRAADR